MTDILCISFRSLFFAFLGGVSLNAYNFLEANRKASKSNLPDYERAPYWIIVLVKIFLGIIVAYIIECQYGKALDPLYAYCVGLISPTIVRVLKSNSEKLANKHYKKLTDDDDDND